MCVRLCTPTCVRVYNSKKIVSKEVKQCNTRVNTHFEMELRALNFFKNFQLTMVKLILMSKESTSIRDGQLRTITENSEITCIDF